jgi:hypothetical protein
VNSLVDEAKSIDLQEVTELRVNKESSVIVPRQLTNNTYETYRMGKLGSYLNERISSG